MISKCFPLAFLISAGLTGGYVETGHVVAADFGMWRVADQEAARESGLRACPPPSAKLKKEELFDILEEINSRSTAASEPSKASEQQYVEAIRSWLNSLEPGKQEAARKIMREAHSDLHTLREAIRLKKQELASLSFNKGMPPETLPRLGMELQNLRASLGRELSKMSDRLRCEAGIDVDSPDSQTFWFMPPHTSVH